MEMVTCRKCGITFNGLYSCPVCTTPRHYPDEQDDAEGVDNKSTSSLTTSIHTIRPTNDRSKYHTYAPKYYLCIDLEAAGRGYKHHINALGIYFAPVNPKKYNPNHLPVIKQRWALEPLPNQTYEDRTVREFWSKFPTVRQWIDCNGLPAATVMQSFKNIIIDLVLKVGVDNIKIVSDSPDFDIGRLDWLGFQTQTWELPIRYLGTETRHSLCNPNERLKQLGPHARGEFEQWMKRNLEHVKHTHFPDDDAEFSYWQMVYCDQHVPKEKP